MSVALADVAASASPLARARRGVAFGRILSSSNRRAGVLQKGARAASPLKVLRSRPTLEAA
jgi:hypothetical protein